MAVKIDSTLLSPSVASICAVLQLFVPGFSFAACDNFSPASGEHTTCLADPVPVNQPVIAQTDSSQVSVNIATGATVEINDNNAVLIYNDSRAENLGMMTVTGDTFDALSSRGSGNIQLNAGEITTEGFQSEGLFSEGNGNQLTNSATGTITTHGANSSAIANISSNGLSNNLLINDGIILTTGDGGDGIYAQSGSNQLINNGTITTTGSVAHGLDGNGASNTLTNNAFISTSGIGSNGLNSVGGISGPVINNGSITTLATNANGVYFSHPGTFTNSSTGTITASGAYGAYLSAGGTVNNAGTITAGRSAITNDVGPTIVNNTGNLTSGSADYGIWFFNSPGDVLNNSGNITGGNGIAVQFTAGNDQFIWHDSGVIQGSVLMDAGDDSATLRNLSEVQLGNNILIDGGQGGDSLLFDNTQAANPGRFINLESLSLSNHSRLTVDTPLILGDSITGSGSLTIDATSQLLAGEQAAAQISPAVTGNQVTVTNAGIIDLANGGTSTTDNLTIRGNYIGQNGVLRLQTVLGSDDSPADKMTIDGGQASGSTQIQVINIAGPGAATLANGILLVDTLNGGTTTTHAFRLSGGQISAGAYEYRLFRGGLAAGSENNWFLRNSLIVIPPGEPNPPVDPGTPPVEPGKPPVIPEKPPVDPGKPPVDPGTPPTEPATPAPQIIPLYRAEVPLYAVLPPLAFKISLAQIATFHERQGEQAFLTGNGSWGRILGSHTSQHWAGDVAPSFDGNTGGLQIGQDFYSNVNDNAGLFFGYTRIDGDVRGSIEGKPNQSSGSTTLNGYSVGAYWTHLWQNQAYLDAVLMYTWLKGSQNSERDIHADVEGNIRSASLETGYPLPLSTHWTLEPQAQIIAQQLTLNDSHDSISSIHYDDESSLTGRAGLRLQGDYSGIKPSLSLNYWQSASHTSRLYLGEDGISTSVGGKALQVGLGVSAQLSPASYVYITANQTSDLDDQHRRDYSGNMGVRINW